MTTLWHHQQQALDLLTPLRAGESNPEIPLLKAPLNLLDARQKVIRGLVELNKVNGWTEDTAEAALEHVQKAMGMYGVVFYEP